MSASNLLASLFKYKAWANIELFQVLQSLDAVAHKAERHSAIRIMNHIYVVDRIFAAHLAGRTHGYSATNTTETPALETLAEGVLECDDWYVRYTEEVSTEKLEERIAFTFTDGAHGTMSREEMLAHVVTHGGYHRGAVGRVLVQLSMAPPRDIFTVYLHQAEPGRRTAP